VAAEIAALGHPLDLILCERPASDRTRASTRLSSRAAGTDGCTPPQVLPVNGPTRFPVPVQRIWKWPGNAHATAHADWLPTRLPTRILDGSGG
jgi:hypothetical protein